MDIIRLETLNVADLKRIYAGREFFYTLCDIF